MIGRTGWTSFLGVDVPAVEREVLRLAALVALVVASITILLPALLARAATAGA